jgi:hypothetical protein
MAASDWSIEYYVDDSGSSPLRRLNRFEEREGGDE